MPGFFYRKKKNGRTILGHEALMDTWAELRGKSGLTLAQVEPLVTWGFLLSPADQKEVRNMTRWVLEGNCTPSPGAASSSAQPQKKKAKASTEDETVAALFASASLRSRSTKWERHLGRRPEADPRQFGQARNVELTTRDRPHRTRRAGRKVFQPRIQPSYCCMVWESSLVNFDLQEFVCEAFGIQAMLAVIFECIYSCSELCLI